MLAPNENIDLTFRSNLANRIQRPPDFIYPSNFFDYFVFVQLLNNVFAVDKNGTSMKKLLWLMELRWEIGYKSPLHYRLLRWEN